MNDFDWSISGEVKTYISITIVDFSICQRSLLAYMIIVCRCARDCNSAGHVSPAWLIANLALASFQCLHKNQLLRLLANPCHATLTMLFAPLSLLFDTASTRLHLPDCLAEVNANCFSNPIHRGRIEMAILVAYTIYHSHRRNLREQEQEQE